MSPLLMQKAVFTTLLSLLLLVAATFNAQAANGIAVLNFELKDLTMQPNTPQARAFTAKVAPLLRKQLAHDGLKVIDIPAAAQNKANAGMGYLYQHSDVAAQLAQNYGAAFVVVGRVHRPTFLFQYLKAHLVDVRTGRLVGDFEVELKGQQDRLLKRGVQSLAGQIEGGVKSVSH